MGPPPHPRSTPGALRSTPRAPRSTPGALRSTPTPERPACGPGAHRAAAWSRLERTWRSARFSLQSVRSALAEHVGLFVYPQLKTTLRGGVLRRVADPAPGLRPVAHGDGTGSGRRRSPRVSCTCRPPRRHVSVSSFSSRLFTEGCKSFVRLWGPRLQSWGFGVCWASEERHVVFRAHCLHRVPFPMNRWGHRPPFSRFCLRWG